MDVVVHYNVLSHVSYGFHAMTSYCTKYAYGFGVCFLIAVYYTWLIFRSNAILVFLILIIECAQVLPNCFPAWMTREHALPPISSSLLSPFFMIPCNTAYSKYPEMMVEMVIIGWISDQDIIFQDLFCTIRCSRKKKNK